MFQQIGGLSDEAEVAEFFGKRLRAVQPARRMGYSGEDQCLIGSGASV